MNLTPYRLIYKFLQFFASVPIYSVQDCSDLIFKNLNILQIKTKRAHKMYRFCCYLINKSTQDEALGREETLQRTLQVSQESI